MHSFHNNNTNLLVIWFTIENKREFQKATALGKLSVGLTQKPSHIDCWVRLIRNHVYTNTVMGWLQGQCSNSLTLSWLNDEIAVSEISPALVRGAWKISWNSIIIYSYNFSHLVNIGMPKENKKCISVTSKNICEHKWNNTNLNLQIAILKMLNLWFTAITYHCRYL